MNRFVGISICGVLLVLLDGCVERLIIEERDVDIERICDQVCISHATCPPEIPFENHEDCLIACNSLPTWEDPCTVEEAVVLECMLELSCEDKQRHLRDAENGPCAEEAKELNQCGRDNDYI